MGGKIQEDLVKCVELPRLCDRCTFDQEIWLFRMTNALASCFDMLRSRLGLQQGMASLIGMPSPFLGMVPIS